VVIGELLEKIKAAEANAAKILVDAQNKADAIERAAALEVEKIKTAAEDTIAKLKFKTSPARAVAEVTSAPLSLDKVTLENAKKYIIAEFQKRYAQ